MIDKVLFSIHKVPIDGKDNNRLVSGESQYPDNGVLSHNWMIICYDDNVSHQEVMSDQ